MKRDLAIYALILLCVLYACIKDSKDPKTRAIVVRDCTGTYLRMESKDYHVCNLEKVKPFETGASVLVKFKKTDSCTNCETVCMMLHENEGWIEVQAIQ